MLLSCKPVSVLMACTVCWSCVSLMYWHVCRSSLVCAGAVCHSCTDTCAVAHWCWSCVSLMYWHVCRSSLVCAGAVCHSCTDMCAMIISFVCDLAPWCVVCIATGSRPLWAASDLLVNTVCHWTTQYCVRVLFLPTNICRHSLCCVCSFYCWSMHFCNGIRCCNLQVIKRLASIICMTPHRTNPWSAQVWITQLLHCKAHHTCLYRVVRQNYYYYY